MCGSDEATQSYSDVPQPKLMSSTRRFLDVLKSVRDDVSMQISFTIPWEKSDPKEMAGEAPSMQSGSTPASQLSLQFHASAREHFDAKALALLSQNDSMPFIHELTDANTDSPDSGVIATPLPPNSIRQPIEVYHDVEGTVVARSFVEGEVINGLQHEGYRDLRRLAEAMQRTPALRTLCGVATIERLLFEWFRETVIARVPSSASDYILRRLEKKIWDHHLFYPIFRVAIPGVIQIGRVTLRTLAPDDLDGLEARARGSSPTPQTAHNTRYIFELARRKHQGFAIAEITLRGEAQHVLRIGRQEADQAVAILRLFSFAMISPKGRSFCTLHGRHNLESTVHFMLSSDGAMAIGSDVDTEVEYVWRIEREFMSTIEPLLIDLVAAVYSDRPSEFTMEVKAALFLYSQSALRSDPAEKLLTILIPLESLLLRSQSEPITDNIAHRLAFAIGESLEERKRIVQISRSAYALRSAYVHHLKTIDKDEDLATMREFMEYAWEFFLTIGTSVNTYTDRSEFLTSLDDRKLS